MHILIVILILLFEYDSKTLTVNNCFELHREFPKQEAVEDSGRIRRRAVFDQSGEVDGGDDDEDDDDEESDEDIEFDDGIKQVMILLQVTCFICNLLSLLQLNK